MKIEKIAYEQLFPTGVYANQRLRVEVILDEYDFTAKPVVNPNPPHDITHLQLPNPEEVIQKAFAYAKQVVNDAFVKMNPQITWDEKPTQPIENETIELTPEDGLIEIIDQCRTIQLLERQRKQVERMGSPRVTERFENKLKNLKGEHN